jgi:light-regulated signal transduction histidine kinase (bacteriophytochrome)
MSPSLIPAELRNACRTHARLLDGFIELTRAELDKQSCSFAQESLREMLEALRSDRKHYGTLAGLVAVVDNRAA